VTSVEDTSFGIEEATEGDARVFRLSGDLDMETAPTLNERLHEAIGDGQTHFIVDVSGLTFIDSTGISVLLHSLKDVERLDGRLVLRSPTERTLRVLEIVGLRELFGL
jgi:anti-sigma B factor antagonist